MSIIKFEKEIFVDRSTKNNPFTNNPFYAKLIGWNPETRNFIFDFMTPIFDSREEGGIIKGEKEMIYVLNAADFHLIGEFKDNLLGLLKLIKYVGALHKIENIPQNLKAELFKDELQEMARNLVSFMKTLLQINSGELKVEVLPVEQDPEECNNDLENGNVIPNLSGQYYIKDEELENAASQLLISGDGRPNWANINVLKEGGFDVFPIERDSFGWLSAAVRTQKGLIFFG